MALRADDFGCIPTGRVLDGVKTTAGSTIVHVASAVLRSSDVGKPIAIPGGIDLVVEISRLDGRRHAPKSTMAMNENTLTVVFDPDTSDRFESPFEGGDVGKRIVVSGAGPGGADLLTFVAARIDDNTIELELPAQTPVNGVLAVLNRPETVFMSDFALGPPPCPTRQLISEIEPSQMPG